MASENKKKKAVNSYCHNGAMKSGCEGGGKGFYYYNASQRRQPKKFKIDDD
jgi:hypothetical protein